MPWKVKVKTEQGKDEVFEALDCAVLTPEQKLLWETTMEGQKQITLARVTLWLEVKLDEFGKSVSDYLKK